MKTHALRLVCSFAVVVILSHGLTAEVRVVRGAFEQNGLTVYKMTVTAAPEPVPALKLRMWLRPHELRPGNAPTHYTRSFAENSLTSTWRHVREKYGDAVDEWGYGTTSIEEFPLEDVRDATSTFDTIVEQFIQPGTRCRESDWGLALEDLRGPESITFLLPEFQQSREIGRILTLRARLAVAERRYDDAIENIRMNYRLGRDVGKEKVLVCNLIGIAIQGIADTGVIDLIAAPDSPNLYWALREVPTPLIDCREAIRLEMSLGTRIFPPLMDVETTEHSPGEWGRLLAEGVETFQEIGQAEDFETFGPLKGLRSRFAGLALSLVEYPAAKQRLITAGTEASRVEQMPVGQVILVDAAREYRRIADEVEKWWYVPYLEARIRALEAEQVWQEESSPLNIGRTIANLLLPAVQAVRMAQIRSEWKKNALLVLEALRMHAAETGEFPASLDHVQVVPVPLNPITNEPYVYRLDGATAVLELPFSDGMPGVAYRYEMTLAQP